MKNKVLAVSLVFVVIILFQISNSFAQKPSCIENSAEEHCIEFDPGNYLGYYQIKKDNSVPAGLNEFYSKKQTLKLNKGIYTLIIGFEANRITFSIKSGGNIGNPTNSIAFTHRPKKIKFETVGVFINPDKYSGEYFLGAFRPNSLYYEEKLCPFSKNPQPANSADSNCPADRIPETAVNLVRGLRYYVEIYGVGIDTAIYFDIDKFGNTIFQDNPRAAEIISENNKKLLKFRNRTVTITSLEYKGRIKIASAYIDIIPMQPVTFTFVPYTPVSMTIIENNGQTFMLAAYAISPKKIFLRGDKNLEKFYQFEIE